MSTRIIKIETIRAGQPRAYADSIYEYIFEYKLDGENIDLDPELTKRYVKALCRNFNESSDRKWYEGILNVFEKLSKGKWRIKIIEPYTG